LVKPERSDGRPGNFVSRKLIAIYRQ